MKVLVVVDGHLGKTPDGRVWSERIYNYSFFARYLSTFDSVRVVIRIKNIENNNGYPNLCSGSDIEFYPVEEFKGPKEYITKYMAIRKNMHKYFEGCDCAIFRIPSTLGYQFLHGFEKTGKPYSIEVVVDPWDFAAPGMLKTPLRPIIRWKWTKDLERACLRANGTAYVTEYALQKKYPSYARINGETEKHFDGFYSSVNISKEFFGNPRKYSELNDHPIKIIHVTNYIGNHVKGHKELIEAVALLKNKGLIVLVEFVGEGNIIPEFTQYADSLKISKQINFSGKISTPEKLRDKLIEADMFVFPSHAEGLPRVLIEAMAVGLPCISTNINGIPELLEKDFLVHPGQTAELAEKIERFITNPKVMTIESKRNIETAMKYEESCLQIKRKDFYMKLRNLVSNRAEPIE